MTNMKSIAIVVGLLAASVVAQPHGHKHRRAHFHGHQKRDLVTVYETEMEVVTVTKYIDETTTSWITPAAKVTTSTSKAAPTTSEVPGQFFEGAQPSAAPAPSKPSPAPAADVPVPTVAPAAAPTVAVEAPPPPPPAPTPSPAAAAPVVAAAAPAVAQGAGPSNKSGADTHTGDLTYYQVGMGACGEDDTNNTEYHIVALSHLLMGTQSNGNPYCGKSITISYGGKEVVAVVKDKCMGCAIDNIDIDESAFVSLTGSTGVGRTKVNWWFN